jgi:fucose permease
MALGMCKCTLAANGNTDDHCRATLSPLIATEMIKSGLRWNLFYFTLLGGSVLELMASTIMFWKENADSFRDRNRRSPDSAGGSRTTEAMKNPITWLIAVWLFVYMGVEGALPSLFYERTAI